MTKRQRDDLPPLLWHAELGRSLPDVWTGEHQRGTQLRDNVQILFEYGAREVHMRPACPCLIHPCEFLNFSTSRSTLDLAGRTAIVTGASRGIGHSIASGLLERGARSVVAVDVGYGQLHARLRGDPRVVVLERTHVRELAAAALPFGSLVRMTGMLASATRPAMAAKVKELPREPKRISRTPPPTIMPTR